MRRKLGINEAAVVMVQTPECKVNQRGTVSPQFLVKDLKEKAKKGEIKTVRFSPREEEERREELLRVYNSVKRKFVYEREFNIRILHMMGYIAKAQGYVKAEEYLNKYFKLIGSPLCGKEFELELKALEKIGSNNCVNKRLTIYTGKTYDFHHNFKIMNDVELLEAAEKGEEVYLAPYFISFDLVKRLSTATDNNSISYHYEEGFKMKERTINVHPDFKITIIAHEEEWQYFIDVVSLAKEII